MNKTPAQSETYKIAYGFGITGLIIMAAAGFSLSTTIMNWGPAAWGFSGLVSLATAIFISPFWFIIGINCLFKIKSAPESYTADLVALGVLNLLGGVITTFFPILYKMMLLVWFLFYTTVFGWLFYRSYRRKNHKKPKATKVTKGANDMAESDRATRFWITLVICIAVLLIIALLATSTSFSNPHP